MNLGPGIRCFPPTFPIVRFDNGRNGAQDGRRKDPRARSRALANVGLYASTCCCVRIEPRTSLQPGRARLSIGLEEWLQRSIGSEVHPDDKAPNGLLDPSIVQAADRYLWLVTEFGLARFDSGRPVPMAASATAASPVH